MRHFKPFLLLAILMVMLAGCGEANNSAQSQTQSNGPTQITFWYGLGKLGQAQHLQRFSFPMFI